MEFTDRTEMDYFRELVKGIFHYMGPLNAPLSISEQIWHPNFASSKPFSNPAATAKCESASTNGVEMKWTDTPKWITTQQHRRLIKPSLCRQKKKNLLQPWHSNKWVNYFFFKKQKGRHLNTFVSLWVRVVKFPLRVAGAIRFTLNVNKRCFKRLLAAHLLETEIKRVACSPRGSKSLINPKRLCHFLIRLGLRIRRRDATEIDTSSSSSRRFPASALVADVRQIVASRGGVKIEPLIKSLKWN